jgi:LacI family transcriptional regulator
MPDPTQVARQLRLFREWVLQAGRPVGLMACNDDQAVRYASACHHVGLRVPEDVAVLGVDDDEVLCESCLPPLSSVRCQGDRVGWTAAAVLDRMLKGQAAPDRLEMVPPVGVRTRPSTEMLAIEDPIVADALGYIRRHAGEPIDAREVMAEVPISRRMLEIRFKRHTGMTLCQAIRQQHLCRARDLLTDTDLSILEVALRSGFANSQRLNETFRKAHGLSPSAWRTRHRGLR